jgi:hypothetical protein
MVAAPHPRLSLDRAWSCVMLNLSLPGWGSLKGGRRLAGVSQLIIVFAGFFLLLAWMMKWFFRIVDSEIGDALPPVPATWLWMAGVICFGVSLAWMSLTCVSLVREAKKNEATRNIPPKLS